MIRVRVKAVAQRGSFVGRTASPQKKKSILTSTHSCRPLTHLYLSPPCPRFLSMHCFSKLLRIPCPLLFLQLPVSLLLTHTRLEGFSAAGFFLLKCLLTAHLLLGVDHGEIFRTAYQYLTGSVAGRGWVPALKGSISACVSVLQYDAPAAVT